MGGNDSDRNDDELENIALGRSTLVWLDQRNSSRLTEGNCLLNDFLGTMAVVRIKIHHEPASRENPARECRVIVREHLRVPRGGTVGQRD